MPSHFETGRLGFYWQKVGIASDSWCKIIFESGYLQTRIKTLL
jgi:hypothetical protein